MNFIFARIRMILPFLFSEAFNSYLKNNPQIIVIYQSFVLLFASVTTSDRILFL